MLNLHSIQKKILLSIGVNIALFLAFVPVMLQDLDGKHRYDGFLCVLAGFAGSVTGLVCLVLWIKMLMNRKHANSTLVIFSSIHMLVLGLGCTIMCIMYAQDDHLFLYFLFPLFTGIVSTLTMAAKQLKNGHS